MDTVSKLFMINGLFFLTDLGARTLLRGTEPKTTSTIFNISYTFWVGVTIVSIPSWLSYLLIRDS